MPFKKGEVANPGGLSNLQRRMYRKFYKSMFDAWVKEGDNALMTVAREDPAKFIQVAAGMMPKQMIMEMDVKETKVIKFDVALKELTELVDRLGMDVMKQLPHNKEAKVIEHKDEDAS